MGPVAVLLAGLLLALSGGEVPAPEVTAAAVYFSPAGGATAAVVAALGQARRTVRVQAYSFTSAPIAKALIDAAARGVDVRVILDKSNRSARYSSADFLLHQGIATWIDGQHAIAHNKVMVIDDAVVVTGSFNFTTAAEKHNAENLLVLSSVPLAKRYLANWQLHLAHSEVYAGRADSSR